MAYKGEKLSYSVKLKMRESSIGIHKGENNYRYSKIPTYSAVHNWLNRYFGKADICENPKCERRSIHYEYALIKGCSYIRDRSHFKKLCKVCHKAYDYIK